MTVRRTARLLRTETSYIEIGWLKSIAKNEIMKWLYFRDNNTHKKTGLGQEIRALLKIV